MKLPDKRLDYEDIDKVLGDFVDNDVVNPDSSLKGNAYDLRIKIIELLDHNYHYGTSKDY